MGSERVYNQSELFKPTGYLLLEMVEGAEMYESATETNCLYTGPVELDSCEAFSPRGAYLKFRSIAKEVIIQEHLTDEPENIIIEPLEDLGAVEVDNETIDRWGFIGRVDLGSGDEQMVQFMILKDTPEVDQELKV